MSDTINKDSGIYKIQEAYSQFEAILAPLSEAQMLTSGVNGSWSVKDNLAHLTAWLNYLQEQLQGVISKQKPPEWMSGLSTEDEINAFVYQQNKDRPLADVLADFRATHQHVIATLEMLSEESLNAPFPWSKSDNPVYSLVAGNTTGHYEEHGTIIQNWLENR